MIGIRCSRTTSRFFCCWKMYFNKSQLGLILSTLINTYIQKNPSRVRQLWRSICCHVLLVYRRYLNESSEGQSLI
uniref:Uncharacterized protein n=1 Tax=Pararge aegeria TaxID=116150 RepID=S4P7C9_9NEOP